MKTYNYFGTRYKNNIEINVDERLNERKLREFRKIKKNREKPKIQLYNRAIIR